MKSSALSMTASASKLISMGGGEEPLFPALYDSDAYSTRARIGEPITFSIKENESRLRLSIRKDSNLTIGETYRLVISPEGEATLTKHPKGTRICWHEKTRSTRVSNTHAIPKSFIPLFKTLTITEAEPIKDGLKFRFTKKEGENT